MCPELRWLSTAACWHNCPWFRASDIEGNVEISVDQFETYADGLDHPEDLAFDSEGVLWAGGELGQVYRIPERGLIEEGTNIGGFCLGLTFSAADDLYICNAKLASI